MRVSVGMPALAAASLVLLALLIGACGRLGFGDEGGGGIVIEVRTPTATPTPTSSTPAPSLAPTPPPVSNPEPTSFLVCTFNDYPAPPELLQLQEPQPEAEVGVPILVRGWGSSSDYQERGVAVAVVTAEGELLDVLEVLPLERDDQVPPEGLDDTEFTSPFAAEVSIADVSEPTPFCLWVYLETTEDGVPVDALQVPVVVIP